MKEHGQLQICTGQEHVPVTGRQQEHLPPASVEIKPCAAVAAGFTPLRVEFSAESATLCSRETGGTGLQIGIFRNSLHDSNPCISSHLEKH